MALRRLPIPREHGAWAILLAAAALAWAHPWVRGWPAAVLTLLFAVAFAIQEPIRGAAMGRERPRWGWIAAYATFLLGGAAYLVATGLAAVLVPAALFGIALTAADLALRRRRRQRQLALRLAGGAGLTLLLPAVLSLGHERPTLYAFLLWALTLTWFGTRVVAVRAQSAARDCDADAARWRWAAVLSQAAVYAGLGALVALRLASPFLAVGYVPGPGSLFVRGPETGMRRTGWREAALLAWFVVGVTLSYHLGGFAGALAPVAE